ncbi:hypothetical protein WS67_21425 [Burkholderia singularis]|uniref:Uncharacterized protein n=1 Tax=Burkholderia singularis TaxID=1503053 RepID=A0A118DLT0_9BURK|nr:hypothetical protein [Burkholderia singularis]KVE23794.1 hypothetical protein WS67_21425 [Burkholderia singularis]
MIESAVTHQLLAAFGFHIDEKNAKSFRDSIESVAKSVADLIDTVHGAMQKAAAGILAIASKFEQLYLEARRTNPVETGLGSPGLAALSLGVPSEHVSGVDESLIRRLRNNPASDDLLRRSGVQTRDASGNLHDSFDMLMDFGAWLAKLVQPEAIKQAAVFGIGEDLLFPMLNRAFWANVRQHRDIPRSMGMDRASDSTRAFTMPLRELETASKKLGIRAENAMLDKIGLPLTHMRNWMNGRGEKIANRVAGSANAFGASAVGKTVGDATLLGRLLPFTTGLSAGGRQLPDSTVLGKGTRNMLVRYRPKQRQYVRGEFIPAAEPKERPTTLEVHHLRNLADTAFGKLIARGEGDYNSVNRGKAGNYKSGKEDLEGMTVSEVLAAQQAQRFNAAGRYQITKHTLIEAIRSMRLKGDEKFDRSMQDRIFEEFLADNKRRAIADYLTGRSNQSGAALYAIAKEWASVAVPKGMKTESGRISDGTITYYDRSGQNRASIPAAEMLQALQNTRAMYQQTPALPVPSTDGENAPRSVEIMQNIRIEINGVSDPKEAGREVARQQSRVANDMVREMDGVMT